MKQQEEKQNRQRKAGIQRGEVTQRMMTFRVDNELLEWMNLNTANKGRFINDSIRKEIEKRGGV